MLTRKTLSKGVRGAGTAIHVRALRPAWLCLVLAVCFAAAACSGGNTYGELKPQLCTQEDVGPDYQQLTDGDFSVRDLADLGPDADRREGELRAAGARHGRFVLFKQSLPKPPFEPPVNVVCQALQFDSAASASAFVANLRPDDSLATTAMIWIPRGDRAFAAEDASREGSARSARFTIRAGSGEERMNAVYQAVARGDVVLTMVVGEADGTPSAEQRTRFAETVAARDARLGREGR